MELLQRAIRDNISTKSVKHNATNYRNYINILIKVKNKLRKRWQKIPIFFLTKEQLSERLIYKSINNFNSKKIEATINNLNPYDGSSWKFCSKYTKKVGCLPSVIVNKNNLELLSDKDKVEAFADHFANISNKERNVGIESFSQKVERVMKKFISAPVNINEIKFVSFTDISKNLKTKKAPGAYNISSKILKLCLAKRQCFF